MTRSNAGPEERDLFDLPLAPPSERWEEPTPPASRHEPDPEPAEADTLDLFPVDEEMGDDSPDEMDEEPMDLPHDEQEPAAPRPSLFVDRILADLIDLAAALGALTIAWIGALMMGIQVGLAAWPAFASLGLVFSFLYQTIPLAFWGSTPGMGRRSLETRAADGGRITFRQAAMRWAGWLVTLTFLGVPYVVALSSRSLADRVSGSHTLRIS